MSVPQIVLFATQKNWKEILCQQMQGNTGLGNRCWDWELVYPQVFNITDTVMNQDDICGQDEQVHRIPVTWSEGTHDVAEHG